MENSRYESRYESCFDSYLEFSKMSLFFEICFISYETSLSQIVFEWKDEFRVWSVMVLFYFTFFLDWKTVNRTYSDITLFCSFHKYTGKKMRDRKTYPNSGFWWEILKMQTVVQLNRSSSVIVSWFTFTGKYPPNLSTRLHSVETEKNRHWAELRGKYSIPEVISICLALDS